MINETDQRTRQFGGGRTAWIISYTPVCKEPRVIRQAMALRDSGWRVVVFGLDGPTACPDWWHHVPLPVSLVREQPASRPVRQAHMVPKRPAQIVVVRKIQTLVRLIGRVPASVIKTIPMLALRAGQVLASAKVPSLLRQYGARIHDRFVEGFECKRIYIRNYANDITQRHPDQKPLLVLCHDYFTADIGWQVACRFRARIVIDCHEYASGQYMQDPHWVRWHRSRVIALQQYYLSRADAITTVCEGIAGLLDDEYKLKRPVRVVRSVPFFVEQTFRPAVGTLTVLYHGEIYASRGLHFAVRSLPLWRPEFRLVMRGYSDPAYVEELWRLAHEFGVADRLSIEPPVAFHEIVPAANQADIGYFVHQDISPQRRFVLPNKFFEYVMAGLALCVSDLPEMARLVRQFDLGMLVADCNEQAIADAINSFDRERINAYKKRSIEAAHELNWETERRHMLSLYEELLQ
jgi:glycosyltransferase involved in cell wall biosynthesis